MFRAQEITTPADVDAATRTFIFRDVDTERILKVQLCQGLNTAPYDEPPCYQPLIGDTILNGQLADALSHLVSQCNQHRHIRELPQS